MKLRHTLACRVLGGGLENDLESWQEVLERGGCEVEEYSCM